MPPPHPTFALCCTTSRTWWTAQRLNGDVRQFASVTWCSGLGGNPSISRVIEVISRARPTTRFLPHAGGRRRYHLRRPLVDVARSQHGSLVEWAPRDRRSAVSSLRYVDPITTNPCR